jgi:hypothetical protein
VNNNKVTLTEQERDDYYNSISQDDYWTKVHWASDRETPGSGDHNISHGQEDRDTQSLEEQRRIKAVELFLERYVYCFRDEDR